jgi:antitoxin CptB
MEQNINQLGQPKPLQRPGQLRTYTFEGRYLGKDRVEKFWSHGYPVALLPQPTGASKCLSANRRWIMDPEARLKRLKFRAWHRGTREADYMVGGFFDAHCAEWSAADMDWFEALLEEQDVDIIGWAMGTIAVPEQWEGPMMDAFRKLDFIRIPE